MLRKLPGSVQTLAAGLFIQGGTLAQGVLIARLLGPTGRGEFTAATLPATFLAGIGLAGSNLAITRLAAKSPELGPLARSSVWLGLLTSLVTGLAGLGLTAVLLPPDQRHLVPLALCFLAFIPFNHLSLNLLGVLQGMEDFFAFNALRLVFYVVYLGLLIGLAFLHTENLFLFIGALLIGQAAAALAELLIVFRRVPLRGAIIPLGTILRAALPYAGFLVGEVVYQSLDKYVLLWLLGPNDLGFYVVAASAATGTTVLTTSLGVVAFTRAAKAEAGAGFAAVGRSFRQALILSVLAVGFFWVALPWLIPLVFGRQFQAAILPATILLASSTFAGLASLLGQSLQGQGRPLLCSLAKAAFIPCAVGLGYLGARRYGLPGATIAITLGQFVVLVLHMILVLRHYENATVSMFVPQKADMVALAQSIRHLLKRLGAPAPAERPC